jgi:hypothetical protein
MPRTLLGDEIIESLSSVAAYREVVGTHGDSTTDRSSVVGTNTDTVAVGHQLRSNDPAYIAGDQGAELNEVSSIATNVITWKRKRLYADSIGAVVKEMTRIRSRAYLRRLGRDLGQHRRSTPCPPRRPRRRSRTSRLAASSRSALACSASTSRTSRLRSAHRNR